MRLGAAFAASLVILISPAVYGADTKGQLLQAAAEGDTATVQALLAAGADVNAKSKDGQSALMLASFQGHTSTVRVLVLNGARLIRKKGKGSRSCGDNDANDSIRAIAQVIAAVEENYADPVDTEKAVYAGAIPAMLASLDSTSRFYDALEYRGLRDDIPRRPPVRTRARPSGISSAEILLPAIHDAIIAVLARLAIGASAPRGGQKIAEPRGPGAIPSRAAPSCLHLSPVLPEAPPGQAGQTGATPRRQSRNRLDPHDREQGPRWPNALMRAPGHVPRCHRAREAEHSACLDRVP